MELIIEGEEKLTLFEDLKMGDIYSTYKRDNKTKFFMKIGPEENVDNFDSIWLSHDLTGHRCCPDRKMHVKVYPEAKLVLKNS